MAVPNIARRMALPSETQRDQSPRISRTPSVVSATVAVHAIRGITADGMNEFTCAAYCWNFAKEPQSNVPCHSPKRPATAERMQFRARCARRGPLPSPNCSRAIDCLLGFVLVSSEFRRCLPAASSLLHSSAYHVIVRRFERVGFGSLLHPSIAGASGHRRATTSSGFTGGAWFPQLVRSWLRTAATSSLVSWSANAGMGDG